MPETKNAVAILHSMKILHLVMRTNSGRLLTLFATILGTCVSTTFDSIRVINHLAHNVFDTARYLPFREMPPELGGIRDVATMIANPVLVNVDPI
jgi:hypothetical protein